MFEVECNVHRRKALGREDGRLDQGAVIAAESACPSCHGQQNGRFQVTLDNVASWFDQLRKCPESVGERHREAEVCDVMGARRSGQVSWTFHS